MSTNTPGATINKTRCNTAKITIPAWGVWYLEADMDGEITFTGKVAVEFAGMKLMGSVLSQGIGNGRSYIRLAGGAASWGKELPVKSYVNDAGVKAALVVQDAATECGETISGTIPDAPQGSHFIRPVGAASFVLQSLFPNNWYVDLDGTTKIGKRPKTELKVKATRVMPIDKSMGKLKLKVDDISTIVPGIVIDGMEAVDVTHSVDKDGVQTMIWGSVTPTTNASLIALIKQLDPQARFRGVSEYRVVTASGYRLNLQPVRNTQGMPDLRLVPVKPGVSGCKAQVALGSKVLVGFIDSDESRPYVSAFEDVDGAGFLPTTITLAEGVLPAARMTDPVIAGPFAGTITMGSTKVKVG